jgi:hypothetical protein
LRRRYIMTNVLGLRAAQDGMKNLWVHEDPPGSNSGEYVDIYLASVGLPPGNSWCCAFLYYRLQQAALELKQTSPMPKTGYVEALFMWAEAKGNRVYNNPEPGFAFVEWIASEERYGHTGLVLSCDASCFVSVEGNAADTLGSSDGEGVKSHVRPWLNGEYKFINLEEVSQ